MARRWRSISVPSSIATIRRLLAVAIAASPITDASAASAALHVTGDVQAPCARDDITEGCCADVMIPPRRWQPKAHHRPLAAAEWEVGFHWLQQIEVSAGRPCRTRLRSARAKESSREARAPSFMKGGLSRTLYYRLRRKTPTFWPRI
jgi:hypothetical protein